MLALVSIAILAIVGLRLWPSLSSSARLDITEKTALRLDGAYGPRFAGEMLAQARGYFGNDRTRIEVQSVPDDDEFVRNVVKDRAIGVTTGQKFLLSAWQGEPVVAFGASFLDTPIAVVSLEQSGLRYPADLVGKRIAYEQNQEEGVVFDALVGQLRLARSRIKRISVGDKFDALRRGTVDAIVTNIDDPNLWRGDQRTRFNIIKPQDYGIHIPGLVYFASAQLVRDRPSLILEALKAVLLGWRDVYADLDGAVAAVTAVSPEIRDASSLKRVLQLQRDLVRSTGGRIGEFDPSRWNSLRDFLLFAKLGEENAGVSTMVNYNFVREVYRRSSEQPSPASTGN